MNVKIKPISQLAWTAQQSGCQTLGEFIVWLAMRGVALKGRSLDEARRYFQRKDQS